jgi:hypothetical protein
MLPSQDKMVSVSSVFRKITLMIPMYDVVYLINELD